MKNESPLLQKRDRDKTSNAILSTASILFLERGYAAVSLSLIARQAGVTKSLLHHYYGDKQGLWKAVKDTSVASYAEQQRALFTTNTDEPGAGIASSLAAYFSFLKEHPEVARMFALEGFESDFKPSVTEQDLQAKGIEFVHDLQQQGVLRNDIDPEMTLVLFSALTEHWFVHRDRFAKLNNLETGDAFDARYFEAMSKVFVSGLHLG